jgi:DNA-3-methyladenine glycosylase I
MPTRCTWVGDDELLTAYDDQEWGVPEFDSRALWESLTLSGFQAGLSWITILRRRDAFRKAFREFDPDEVARFTEADIAPLLKDAAIIRSKTKISVTIAGARSYVAMADAGENFSHFAWNFVGNKPIQNTGPMPPQSPLSETISKASKQRGFKFVGPVIVYAWMQSSGMGNEHLPDCFRRRAVHLRIVQVREGGKCMIFYMQMRWNIEGRLRLDEVWDLEIEEAKAAKDGFNLIAMYKVAGQRRVIAIVEIETAEDLDRVILGRLPLREVLEFEAIWPLRSFEGFVEDCRTHFGAKEPASEKRLIVDSAQTKGD